eukprot:1685097-Rhodomonas_salina.1
MSRMSRNKEDSGPPPIPPDVASAVKKNESETMDFHCGRRIGDGVDCIPGDQRTEKKASTHPGDLTLLALHRLKFHTCCTETARHGARLRWTSRARE